MILLIFHFYLFYFLTALPSTSPNCVEDTFISKKWILDDYFSTDEESPDLILLQVIAKDGFPFDMFTTSNDLRNLLIAKDYNK